MTFSTDDCEAADDEDLFPVVCVVGVCPLEEEDFPEETDDFEDTLRDDTDDEDAPGWIRGGRSGREDCASALEDDTSGMDDASLDDRGEFLGSLAAEEEDTWPVCSCGTVPGAPPFEEELLLCGIN